MRLFIASALMFALAGGAAARAAAATQSLDLHADSIGFYSDRYVVSADGNVTLRLSDGTVVRGETFAMDLKQNRYLVAGDVRLDGPHVHALGAAFAGFIDFDRTYFLDANGTPDRWTFFGDDWQDVHAGRDQPGDAFAFPATGDRHPYLVATSATIVPRTNVTFANVRVRAGIEAPVPRYVVTFAPNPNFAQNSLAGARAGFSVPFNGSEHSLSEFDVRNDSLRGTYLAFQQHVVWPRDYVVASVNPLTQPQRQYNLIALKQISPAVQARTFLQLSTTQYGSVIAEPADAASFQNLQVNGGFPHSSFQFNLDHYNWYLLGFDQNKPYDPRWLEHPTDAQFQWSGYRWPIPHTPVLYTLRSGIGWAHDQFGENAYPNEVGAAQITDLWYHDAGVTLTVPTLRLGHGLTASWVGDKQRLWYSTPHHSDTTQNTVSLSRDFGKANAYVAYKVVNTGDYWGAQQLAAWPQGADVVTTAYGTFGGQAAYRGFATARTTTLGINVVPTPYFNVTLTGAYVDDTPRSVPGLYGPPPYQLTGDVRFRLTQQIGVDVQRSYYFNFADLRWTPQWLIQVTP